MGAEKNTKKLEDPGPNFNVDLTPMITHLINYLAYSFILKIKIMSQIYIKAKSKVRE